MRAFPAYQVVRSDGMLQIGIHLSSLSPNFTDVDWYITQQLFPPIVRLCGPIEGTDASQIADCLGLDPTKYHMHLRSEHEGQSDYLPMETLQLQEEDKFKNVEKLTVQCPHCGSKETIDKGSNFTCKKCLRVLRPENICNGLDLAARRFISKYYEYWTTCLECQNRTKQMCYRKVAKCITSGCQGVVRQEVCYSNNDTNRLQYPATALYTQLLYFTTLFDPNSQSKCYQHAQKILSRNERHFLPLGDLFGMFSRPIASMG